MKTNRIIITTILLIGLVSCEKVEFRKDISGVWQFDWQGGPFQGGWYKNDSYTHLKITSNYQYFIYKHDTLKISGKYSVFESEEKNSDFYEPYYVKFNNSNSNNGVGFPFNWDLNVAVIHNDTLYFAERNIDGQSYYFTRK